MTQDNGGCLPIDRKKDADYFPSICQITTAFRPVVGGAERVTETLSQELIGVGVNVSILTRYQSNLSRFEMIRDVPVFRLGIVSPKFLSAGLFVLHSLLKIMFKTPDCDIVHSQSLDAPLIVGMLAKILIHKRLVVTLHGDVSLRTTKASLLGRIRVKLMRRIADRFVVVSQNGFNSLRNEGIQLNQIIHIANGVNLNYFRPPSYLEKHHLRLSMGFDHSDRIMLFVGRLVDLKSVDILIRAIAEFQKHIPSHLLIVGDGPQRQYLGRIAENLGLAKCVHFIGDVNDTLPFYQVSDLFILPSKTEGLSLALLEAMACELPVVVSNIPGNLSVVDPEVTGLVFPVGDIDHLSSTLSTLLIDRNSKLTQLGKASRQAVERTYSLHTQVQSYLNLYQTIYDNPQNITTAF